MPDTSSIYSSTNYNVQSSGSSGTSTMEELQVEDFMKLMIAELQNQDPLNPMDNSDMLSQINQMRQIESNDKLSTTLEAIQLGQSVATAANLIGRTVTGTNQLGEKTTGVVDRVVFENGVPKVYVGNYVLGIDSITEIIPPSRSDSPGNDPGDSEGPGGASDSGGASETDDPEDAGDTSSESDVS